MVDREQKCLVLKMYLPLHFDTLVELKEYLKTQLQLKAD